MSLIAITAVLYADPAPTSAEFIARLAEAIDVVRGETGIELVAKRKVSGDMLGGDLAAFEERGKQIFLSYEHIGDERSLRISQHDISSETAMIAFQPELPDYGRDGIDQAWDLSVRLTKALVGPFQASLAEINGLDEDGDDDHVVPSFRRGTVPDIVTPFTYLEDAEGETLAGAARAAGAHSVQRLGAGWAIQFVERLHDDPPPQIGEELTTAFGDSAPRYVQTRP